MTPAYHARWSAPTDYRRGTGQHSSLPLSHIHRLQHRRPQALLRPPSKGEAKKGIQPKSEAQNLMTEEARTIVLLEWHIGDCYATLRRKWWALILLQSPVQ